MMETQTRPKSGMEAISGSRGDWSGSEKQRHTEGTVARTIEEQTAKLPSDTFLWAAVAAMGCSLFLHLSGKKQESLFVGQWPAPFLLFGIYNKIVKVAGSDRMSH